MPTVGLLGCWAVGLLGCWAVGLMFFLLYKFINY